MVKSVIGVVLNGVLVFVSKFYLGSILDVVIVEYCGILY